METTTYGAGAAHEWIEFEDPANEGEFFRINVSFFLSRFHCIYGAGCPSVKSDLPRADAGCCSQGVAFMDDADREHVIKQVARLTPQDFANYEWVKENTTEDNPGWAQSLNGVPYKTRKRGNQCVFSNPVPQKEGDLPMGCAFHHLAARTGESYVDTKPYTCWVVPMYLDYGTTTAGNTVTTITGSSTSEWGGTEPSSVVYDEELRMPIDYTDTKEGLANDYIAWWCVDTPDAYNGDKAYYKTNSAELTKLMGPAAYARLCELFEKIGTRNLPMPGESVNNGNPTIATISSLYRNLRERRDSERRTKAGSKITDEIGRPEEHTADTTDSDGVVGAVGSGVE